MTIPTARRGITLMEVLISIGILAIGLTSVVSLVPAGQSQAARAVILDRAATAAANGLADAVTFGLTRADSVVISGTSASLTGAVWVFDPAIQRIEADRGAAPLSLWPNGNFPNAVGAMLKTTGIYSSAAPPSGVTAPWQATRLYAQNRDDVVLSPGSGADDPPINTQISGVRAFQGRMSSLYSLALADNFGERPPVAGDVAKLTVVVFHNRTSTDETGLTVPAFWDEATQSLRMNVADIPAGRTFKEIIRPGVVIYDPGKTTRLTQYQRWSQILMASVDDSAGGGTIRAFVTFASPPPSPGSTVRVLLDSVGMAEQMIVVEGSSAYSR
jgi:type II secretory pathway pseudopilin PulG